MDINEIKPKAKKWLTGNYDTETKQQVRDMLEHDETALINSFYKDLEFGTGGLRGIMGAGTNRVNIYTVGSATQGLCNYLKKQFEGKPEISMAIAYDNRNNSRLFAETTAHIAAANGLNVYLFDELRPVPELSFAIRHLGCQAGVVITASHNPKEYSGYKVYWEDGGQIVNPHDKNIIDEVQKISSIDEIKWKGNQDKVKTIGEDIDKVYIDKIKSLSLSPEAIQRQSGIRIVYTPIHGSGVNLVPRALKNIGFTSVYNVPEQDETDGNFPTVVSPNPEEPAALNMAIEKGTEVGADVIMGTDPDADRVGIVVKGIKGEYVILNGNQTAAVLIYYLLTKWAEKNKLTGKEFIVKTIVTTEVLNNIADKYDVAHYDVLTGFKYIAELIRNLESEKTFIGGGEESYGYLVGDFVRDKDAVISCAIIAEIVAWAKDNGKSLFDLLIDIYVEFGFFKEKLISVKKEGKEGAEEIQRMMEDLRNNPPESINQSDVMQINDYQAGKSYDQISHLRYDINLPQSNVLQFILEDNSKITIRPSGTEPKIKIYFGAVEKLPSREQFDETNSKLDKKLESLSDALGIK